MEGESSIRQNISWARTVLPSGPYDNPGLDAMLLMAQASGQSREQLYARMTDKLSEKQLQDFRALVERRKSGEPLAYISGHREFYGLEFSVDARVLIPRPDTETLVEWVLESHGPSALRVHDCCTGSGAIAIALASCRPAWNMSASDISADALRVFEINQRNLLPDTPEDKRRIDAWQDDLLSKLVAASTDNIDVIVSNPPYLTAAECDRKDAQGWAEPRLALDGGTEGLDFIHLLLDQAYSCLSSGGYVYIEASDSQSSEILHALSSRGYEKPEARADLAGLRRVFRGRKA